MTLLVGVDVGTSGLDAVAVDADGGRVVASAHRDYPLSSPAPGWAEQDAEDFAAAAVQALGDLVRALGPHRARLVRGIGLTGQMHTAVLVSGDGSPVRPAILWCDGRTSAECVRVLETLGRDGLARTVHNLPLEGFTLPKLLWLAKHEPRALEATRAVLMPKDWVGFLLTGELGTDASDASGTLLFDPARRAWSEPVIETFGIKRSWLPEAGESTAPLGRLGAAMAEATGLPAGVVVARGAADNAAAAVGLGVLAPGRAMLSIGTSGVVLAPAASLDGDPDMRLHAFDHAVPGGVYRMGVMLSAGGALRWYRDVLGDGERLAAELRGADAYDVIAEAASTAQPGAGGVLFLPYLRGERTPHADAKARGALVGLAAETTKADVSRAVLEGIGFGLADLLALVRETTEVRALRVAGGGGRSRIWRSILAHQLDATLEVTSTAEGAAFGAALCAGVASGVYASLPEACERAVRVVEATGPEPSLAGRYADLHARYRALYPALRGLG